LRAPEAVERALTIFEFSEFLTDILVRHPDEVALLERIAINNDAGEATLFDADSRRQRMLQDPVLAYFAQEGVDRTQAMSILRRRYLRQVFLSGARDLFQWRETFESLDDNSAAADAAIEAALVLSGAPSGFCVMGLGKLGAREFDVLSDADVLFVCEDGCDKEQVRRVAEQWMQSLTAYTRDGSVFPVDARLRPHGREGELIVTPGQLEAYFRDEAKPWEALTYLKLRQVAGDASVAAETLRVVQGGIAEMARRPEFDAELAEVRLRLERSEAGQNFKTGAGGAYDLDYLAGRLQARHELWLAGNLQERLRLLHDRGLVDTEDYRLLAESARYVRTVEHVVRLVTGRPRKWLPVAEHPRRAVQKLLWRLPGVEVSFEPEMRLAEMMRQTREIYDRYWQA